MTYHHLHRFRLSLSTAGLLLGTLFFAVSLSPSLVPRPFLMQALLSGAAFSLGYLTGVFGSWLWRFMEMPVPSGRAGRITKIVLGLACLGVAILFLVQASSWQNSVREAMQMAPVEETRPLSVGLIALGVFVSLLGAARLFRWIKRLVARRADRVAPTRVSLVFGALVAFALFWGLISGVLARFVLHSFDASFRQLDLHVEAETTPPDYALATGSHASLIAWEGIGRQGRRFVIETPRAEDLEPMVPGETVRPLRVYAGLNSAETIPQRVELALAEMKRVRAFDREILVVVTPTGTGWVDPGAITSLEYLHSGNVASVAIQYSYLPSWLSLLAQPDYGEETARALFAAVYRHWRDLERESRPRLYLHGLSLGALNSERSADAWDLIGDPIDGALWSGPPFRSQTWQWVTATRQPDSPAWLPRFRDGSVIRFANQHGGLDTFDAEWGPLRIAYLQYASDPITFFDPASFYRQPDWMADPRGPDVSRSLRWYPGVTMLQLLADIAAADIAPIGYGHAYATEHYIDTWLALTEPDGWTDESVARLKDKIGDL